MCQGICLHTSFHGVSVVIYTSLFLLCEYFIVKDACCVTAYSRRLVLKDSSAQLIVYVRL